MQIQVKCLTALTKFTPLFVPKPVLAKLCDLLKSKNCAIFTQAAEVISVMSVYEETPEVIDNAILHGVLPNLL